MADPSKSPSTQPSGSSASASTSAIANPAKVAKNVRQVKERIINSHKVIALFEGQVKEYHTLQGKYNQSQSELQALQGKLDKIQAETAQHRLVVTTLRAAHVDEVKRREALERMQGSSRDGSNGGGGGTRPLSGLKPPELIELEKSRTEKRRLEQQITELEQSLADKEMDLALIRSHAAENHESEWQQEKQRADQLAGQLAQLETQLTEIRRALEDKQVDYQSVVTRGLSKERELAQVQAQLKSQKEASLALQTRQSDLQGQVSSLTTQLQASHQQRSTAQAELQGRFDVLTAELQATQQQRQQVQDELAQSQLLWADQRAQFDERIRQLSQIQKASTAATLATLEPAEPLEVSEPIVNDVAEIPTARLCLCVDELPKIQAQLDLKDQTIYQLNGQVAGLQREVDSLQHQLNEQARVNQLSSVPVAEGPSVSAQSAGVHTEMQRDLGRLEKENAAFLDLIKDQQVQIFDLKRSAATLVKTPQSLSASFDQPPALPVSTPSQATRVQLSGISNAPSSSTSTSEKSVVQPSRKRRLSVTQNTTPAMSVGISGRLAPSGPLPPLTPTLTTVPLDQVAAAPKEKKKKNKKAKTISTTTNRREISQYSTIAIVNTSYYTISHLDHPHFNYGADIGTPDIPFLIPRGMPKSRTQPCTTIAKSNHLGGPYLCGEPGGTKPCEAIAGAHHGIFM
ncbi:hypothetical protein BJ085DRAFT_33558 [Dimargaris cristalligena]|uniref:Uncharacterized protein n=1 Tax=Dimargaris cristalligena TaxID=215637 RepID=A0A4P9ZQ79_9FUNG|nr:hypothetical protein BJ085DRAFT_33558 [Dimargaris cristalligena]|eukprot:RKP35487.1 hypothetical protein BJ085DRAFT_33558 [Dimargaris cristalligena]